MSIFVVLKEIRLLTFKHYNYGHSFTITKRQEKENILCLC
nr:MAG TPA: hypothetical protein [Microviridae sp.]